MNSPGTSICKVNHLHRHLGTQAELVCCVGPGRLNPDFITSCQGFRDVVRGGQQRPKLRVDFRVIVETSGQISESSRVCVTLKYAGYSGSARQIIEMGGRKDPPHSMILN